MEVGLSSLRVSHQLMRDLVQIPIMQSNARLEHAGSCLYLATKMPMLDVVVMRDVQSQRHVLSQAQH
jgi:hypothetical protein